MIVDLHKHFKENARKKINAKAKQFTPSRDLSFQAFSDPLPYCPNNMLQFVNEMKPFWTPQMSHGGFPMLSDMPHHPSTPLIPVGKERHNRKLMMEYSNPCNSDLFSQNSS